MKKILLFIIPGLVLFFVIRLFSSPSIRNPVPTGENIICFGDSLTYGTGAPEGMDYPSQLSKLISTTIINAGVPGNTTGDALKRLETDVLAKSPRIVLITLGGNDLKNRISKEAAFSNLEQIIDAIQDLGALVIIAGIDIPLFGRGFANQYEKLAEETGAVLIPDIFDGIMGNRELMTDPIHPNGKGYTIMAQRFYKAMKPYL